MPLLCTFLPISFKTYIYVNYTYNKTLESCSPIIPTIHFIAIQLINIDNKHTLGHTFTGLAQFHVPPHLKEATGATLYRRLLCASSGEICAPREKWRFFKKKRGF
jgi:hypothetical protein